MKKKTQKKKSSKSKSKKESESHLLMFHGTECPHCRRMDPIVKRLEKELKVKVTEYEVWHNLKNAKKMQEYDKGLCGGVPFFWNTKTGEFICGEADYGSLKEWAEGK